MQLNKLPNLLKLLFFLIRIIDNVRMEFAVGVNIALASSVGPLDYASSCRKYYHSVKKVIDILNAVIYLLVSIILNHKHDYF